MADEHEQDTGITEEELEEQLGEALPERTQMSIVLPGPPGITLPIMPPEVSDL